MSATNSKTTSAAVTKKPTKKTQEQPMMAEDATVMAVDTPAAPTQKKANPKTKTATPGTTTPGAAKPAKKAAAKTAATTNAAKETEMGEPAAPKKPKAATNTAGGVAKKAKTTPAVGAAKKTAVPRGTKTTTTTTTTTAAGGNKKKAPAASSNSGDSGVAKAAPKRKRSNDDEEKEGASDDSATMGKKKKTPIPKDPTKPKQAKSAYLFYSNATRNEVAAEFPDLTMCQIAEVVGKRWHQLSAADKLPFEKQAAKDKARCALEMKNWKADPEIVKLQRKARRANKDKNAPKKASTAYMLYANTVRDEVMAQNPGMLVIDASRVMGAQWKALSDEEKTPFYKEAAVKKAAYDVEKARYDAMIKAQQEQVVA